MIKIINLIQTCFACPTQFSGETDDGREAYIRFRFGRLSITIDGESIFSESLSDGLDGVISYDKIKEATKHLNIQWPDKYSIKQYELE